jgi:hypothetical protein
LSAQRFRRKPEPVAAIRFDGTNAAEIVAWAGPDRVTHDPEGPGMLIVWGAHPGFVSVGDWVAMDAGGSFEHKYAGEFEGDYELDEPGPTGDAT